MGKGDKKRPSQITREEEDLRWLRFQGKITWEEFEKRYSKLKEKGLIRRSGKVVE